MEMAPVVALSLMAVQHAYSIPAELSLSVTHKMTARLGAPMTVAVQLLISASVVPALNQVGQDWFWWLLSPSVCVLKQNS
jgi:hypothetical protein